MASYGAGEVFCGFFAKIANPGDFETEGAGQRRKFRSPERDLAFDFVESGIKVSGIAPDFERGRLSTLKTEE